MTLLVKEIDKFKSTKHKGKELIEYIIYVMVGHTPIKAFIAIGEGQRDTIIDFANAQYINN